MILKINGLDLTNSITTYSATEEKDVVLNNITMADGSIVYILAPYKQTIINVELSKFSNVDYKNLRDTLTAQNTVNYYSEKYQEERTGYFYIDIPEWNVLKFTNEIHRLKSFKLKLTKMGEL